MKMKKIMMMAAMAATIAAAAQPLFAADAEDSPRLATGIAELDRVLKRELPVSMFSLPQWMTTFFLSAFTLDVMDPAPICEYVPSTESPT